MKKYYINEWLLGEEKPKNITIFNTRELGEERFIEIANERLAKGDTIIHVTHRWCYTFQRKDGEYYKVYMYEATV